MKILPVVVLYKRKLSESDSVNSLIESDSVNEINEIFVYNNSPDSYNIPDVYKGVKIHKIDDYCNSGVSKAYNEGLKLANELGYDYVLLLDQDTTLPADTLKAYKDSILKNKDINLFCPILKTKTNKICSPLKYKFHRGFPVDSFNFGKYSLDEYSPINSGMLLKVSAAVTCGGYNEKAFLDFSDFQFIERFKKFNQDFYVIPLTFVQDFSGDEVNTEKLLSRFKIYCQCAKHCDRDNIADHMIYFFMVLARTIKLTIKTSSFNFLICFYKNYIRG